MYHTFDMVSCGIAITHAADIFSVRFGCHYEIIANVLTVVLDTYPPEGGVCTYITPRAGFFFVPK